ncbi:hypothetical protein C8R48DRAFT_751632 [Suillus tomentosus]|nr:hypothetical protein C8R48DRAFT_751632 [Suillus tomentosus]
MNDDRDGFLLEFLRHDGRGDYASATVCSHCCLGVPQFRCMDCMHREMYCQGCTVALHTQNPTHRIQVWTNLWFSEVSLKDLGLRVQLGHRTGERCLLPERAFNDDFTLIDTNGIHAIALDFCGCEKAQTHAKQILRTAWFPVTTSAPRTAATFRILELYHLLSFEAKVSGYQFYHTIARLTDNTGLRPRKNRYEAFMRMVREWRHLKMLKRAGRGHDPGGVKSTQHGECAVLCPACPHPHKNLPDNWETVPKPKWWLYALFLAIDANFRLKRRMVSKDSIDAGLSRGWAYFVDETEYKSYIHAHGSTPQEVSNTCSSHNAVNMANTKALQGLAATGVGTIDCARHNMKLPNGVGDLQKGERYSNMDFLFFSTLQGRCIDTLNVSYDIACQWHKNLWARMSTIPSNLHLDHLTKSIRFFIPKFHLPAHILKCQTMFSFNFSKHVGRTDGEAPERGWSNINPIASSTKEMGPGSRRDTLDDHFGDWNWKKVVGLGVTLLRKMDEAKEESAAHQAAFEELNGALTPETTTPWKIGIECWEDNPNDLWLAITQAAVRLKLAQLEASQLQQGIDISIHADVSPSVFIALGIDLESEQRQLKVDVAKQALHATDAQMTTIQRLRNSLQRKIEAWKRFQILYTPAVQLLETAIQSPPCRTSDIITPENVKLLLPSALRDWVRGQCANTRAQNALGCVEAKAAAAAEKYHAAHAALSSLAPILHKVGWNKKYKVLDRKDDVHSMSAPKKGESEGRIQLSWIWLVEGVGDDEDEVVQDCLRVEWCKTRARAMQWTEEVELLQEEMRRVLCFLRWHVKGAISSPDIDAEGLIAYAGRQAQLR